MTSRRVAVGFVVLALLALGLGGWDRVLARSSEKMGAVLSAQRIHIEKVTSLRRDTRKTHVALIEAWLTPTQDGPERQAALEKMIATVHDGRAGFMALEPTEEGETPIRQRLDGALGIWDARVTSAVTKHEGPVSLDAVRSALADVDVQADAVLKLNSTSSAKLDLEFAAVRDRRARVQQGFIATVLLAAALALLWRARIRQERAADEAAKREAARAMDLRAQFFSNMSHELRTPLVAIRNLAATFEADVSREKAVETAGHIEREAKDLLHMINNILDLAKLESKGVELLIEDVVLADVVARCVKRCSPLLEGKELTLDVEVPDDLPKVRADFVKLQQVFTNLVANAIKFTEKGAITIRAKSDGHGYVVAKVSDTGIGIEAPALATIWDAFRQADSRIAEKYGGTGLGLAIVKNVLDRLGAKVNVTSKVGEGTTFEMLLPVATPSRAGVSEKSDTLVDS